jgi:hypothetical protein
VLGEALSVTVTVPLADPDAAGAKSIVSWQIAVAGKLPPQLFVTVKFELAVILVIVSVVVPVFVSVSTCGMLCEPTGTYPNDKLPGERAADPAFPPPPEPPCDGPDEPPPQPTSIRMKQALTQIPARTSHFVPSKFPPQNPGWAADRIMFTSSFAASLADRPDPGDVACWSLLLNRLS